MKRYLTVGLTLSLLVVAGFLLSRNGTLMGWAQRVAPERDEPTGMGLLRFTLGFPHFCRLALEGKMGTRKPALSLLIFLSQKECSACLREAEDWERLYRKYSGRGFFVAALVPRPDSQWGEQLRQDYNLSFPVFPVNPPLLSAIGLPPVAFKVMVDSLQRVVHLSAASNEPEERKSFFEVAEKLCRVYLLEKEPFSLGQSNNR